MEAKYIVAIEIGSSKIKGAIGVVEDNAPLKVIAVEEREFIDGVRYGRIQNVEDVRSCVSKIITALESNAQVSHKKIKGVYVSIGGRSTMSYKLEKEMIFDDETEITREIIGQLENQAYEEIPSDREPLEIIPLSYSIDNTTPQNIVGTYGHSLKATYNCITCSPQLMKNINRVIEERLNLLVNSTKVRQLAISELVLGVDEKKLGCMLVDFGAETTTVSIHKGGVMQYMVTIPLGSRNITRDLMSLSITEEQAERVKKVANANPQETVGAAGKVSMVEGVDDAVVNNCVQHRSREIIANIVNQIELSGFKATDLPNGIVTVGGGAKLRGFNSYLENQSGLKVRVGMINNSNIRLSDSSINQSDSLDIIAVLYAVSISIGLEDCLESPQYIENNEPIVIKPKGGVSTTGIDDVGNEDPIPDTPDDDDKSGGRGLDVFKKISEKIKNILTEEED